mmetsp:Transcript_132927/g.231007  ORF Transcript_132927/g.231007 Transcript_132927/m.231007 type:complete len:155 (+) Transcript_132927:103-567(+)
MEFHGSHTYVTGDMFCGTLDVTGKPAGRGILYYFESGECDVAVFDKALNQTGEGIRYSKERDAAFRLNKGEVVGAVDLEEALRIVDLQDTPAVRTKESIPRADGYDPSRHKGTEAYYHYRMLAGLPLNEACYGANPYPPVWRSGADSFAAGATA